MSHSWLQRKRKVELLELAQRANLPDADSYLKDDLVEALQEHLAANETTYGKVSDFSDFYARSGSPVKRERVSSSPGVVVAKTRRRQTLVKNPESEEPTPDKTIDKATSLIARTPRALARRVTEVDIPASPAQLAEVADQSFQVAKTKASELWTKTRIDELKEFLREKSSSVAAIQTVILLIEATGLQWNTLQMTPAFNVPAAAAQYSNSQYVSLPDGWALLTSEWWAPATLWSLTSWVLPLIFSYFFNLTLRSNTHRKSSDRVYTIDPFTFHIAKAILSYSAYRLPVIDTSLVGEAGIARAIDLSWGPFSEQSVGVVRNNVPGGYYGLQIGAFVGILVSLYDAALKK